MPNNISVATIYTIEVQPNIICEHDKSRLSFISEISNKDHPYKISDITIKSILQLCELFVVPYRTMAKRLREIGLISEDELQKFLNESEESINKYRKMYSFVLRDPDERVVMDNLVELAVTAYAEGYVTYEKLEHLLELSNMTPEELGIEKKANYEFPSDDELDSIMEE